MTTGNGQIAIVDKRKNAGAQPPAAAAPAPTVQTSTLPPNPNPEQVPSWAQPAQGARPPIRPLGGGSAVAQTPAAAPAPSAGPPVPNVLSGLAKLPEAQRKLLERMPVPTPGVWLGDAPEEGKGSLTDMIFWSLANAPGGVDEARSWFPHVAFNVWSAFVAWFMVAEIPRAGALPHDATLPENAGAHAAPSADEDDVEDAELAEAHSPLGSTAHDSIEAAGLAAAEEALKEEDRAAAQARGSSGVKRMSKGLREQIHKMIAASATDEQIAEAVAFPIERIADERKKLASMSQHEQNIAAASTPMGVAAAAVDAMNAIATAHFAAAPEPAAITAGGALPGGTRAQTVPPSHQEALVLFLTSTVFDLVRPSGRAPNLEEIDALAASLLTQLEAYATFRGERP